MYQQKIHITKNHRLIINKIKKYLLRFGDLIMIKNKLKLYFACTTDFV